jgi:hypothetical protein
LKTLEKELNKWQNINTQGQNAVSKELVLYRQLVTRDTNNSKEVIIDVDADQIKRDKSSGVEDWQS